MACMINLGDMEYLGTLTLGGATAVKNGVFVVPNWTAGTATPTDATTGDGDVWMVDNIIDTIPEQMIDDLNFTVAVGKCLRLKKYEPGEIFTTTEFNGTPAVGDVLAAGVGGKLEAKAARTPKQTFTVIEKPTLWATTTLKCVVDQK